MKTSFWAVVVGVICLVVQLAPWGVGLAAPDVPEMVQRVEPTIRKHLVGACTDCQPEQLIQITLPGNPLEPVDVVLVLDASVSMTDGLPALKQAAIALVDAIERSAETSDRSHRVAVVIYHRWASPARCPLTSDYDLARAAIRTLEDVIADPTCTEAALETARLILVGAEGDRERHVVLVSDGVTSAMDSAEPSFFCEAYPLAPNNCTLAAELKADELRAAGIKVHTVGYLLDQLGQEHGSDVASFAEGHLERIATTPGHHRRVVTKPIEATLLAWWDQVWVQRDYSVYQLVLTEQVTPRLSVGDSSLTPDGRVGQELTWLKRRLEPGENWTIQLAYDVDPALDGVHAVAQSTTLRYTDAAGDTRELTVPDASQPTVCPSVPVITPRPSITQNADHGCRGAIVWYPLPTVQGGHDTGPVTCSHRPGSLFPVGTTSVACWASDLCDRETSTGFDVTVEAPILGIEVPQSFHVPSLGLRTVPVNLPDATPIGGTPPYTITTQPASGSRLELGETQVLCQIEDACHQVITGTYTVTVDGLPSASWVWASGRGSRILHLLEGEPEPLGWEQLGAPLCDAWPEAKTVDWDAWEDMQETLLDRGQILGWREGGRSVGISGARNYLIHDLVIAPPEPYMAISRATLRVWSDNASSVWFDGKRLDYAGQFNLGPYDLTEALRCARGQTYRLAIRTVNDDADIDNPHGTAFEINVEWVAGEELTQTMLYIPLVIDR